MWYSLYPAAPGGPLGLSAVRRKPLQRVAADFVPLPARRCPADLGAGAPEEEAEEPKVPILNT